MLHGKKWALIALTSVLVCACGGGVVSEVGRRYVEENSREIASNAVPVSVETMVVLDGVGADQAEIPADSTTSNARPQVKIKFSATPPVGTKVILWDGTNEVDADVQASADASFLFSLRSPLTVGTHHFKVSFHADEKEGESFSAIKTFTVKQVIGRTPPMGWASWNNYRTLISEEIIKNNADAMVQKGLRDAGYKYINIDDGWVKGRDENDNLLARDDRFPSGMKAIADYIHSKGLLAGIYSDAGTQSCASIWDRPTDELTGQQLGFYGREERDAKQYFIDWGFDYIKIDWCGGQALALNVQDQYIKIIDAIRKYSEYVFINVCSWSFPGEAVAQIANSWRTGSDIENNFGNVTALADINSQTSEYTVARHFNDADMLQVGRGMTYEEDKAHFSLWAIMAAPLILGNDLTSMTAQTLAIVTNREVIAINQDSAVIPGKMVKTTGTTAQERRTGLQVWLKPLGTPAGDTKAVLLLNRSDSAQSIAVTWADIGLGGAVSVRDVWSATDQGSFTNQYAVNVPSHAAVMLKVRGTPVTPAVVPEEPNLAKNKNVRFESEYSVEQGAAKAVDGDMTTQWTANGDASSPRWIEVDLTSPKPLGLVRLSFADLGGTVYKYKIEGATDRQSWTTLADRTAAGVAPTGPVDEAVQGTYRYVKFTITGVSNGHWPNCKEFEIYSTAQAPAALQSFARQ